MRRRLHRLPGSLVVALALAALGPRFAAAEAITVATYNVENYGPADRMTKDGFRSGYPKPEAEKKFLRQVIRRLHADVLVLQEMGPAAYLEELRRDLRAEGLDYPYAAVADADDPERHVAILSKRRLASAITFRDLDFPYFEGRVRVKRGLLEATITAAGGTVTIFGVHLKSRLTERPDDPLCTIRRTGEAAAIRDRILGRFPDPATARFVVLGDCNDTKVSKALERLQHRGALTVSVPLAAADRNGEAWTYFFRREDAYLRFDYALVSPGLFGAVRGGQAGILGGDDVRAASDHRPVWLTLDLPESG